MQHFANLNVLIKVLDFVHHFKINFKKGVAVDPNYQNIFQIHLFLVTILILQRCLFLQIKI